MNFIENYKTEINKVEILYNNLDNPFILSNKEQVKKFLEEIIVNNGELDVTYIKKPYGRLYAEGVSIQMIPSVIRNYLLENKDLVEIDMKSAITNVIEAICDEEHIDIPELKYYNRNRQHIIDKYYDGDTDKCKLFVNKAMSSNTSLVETHNTFEEKVLKEIKVIQDYLYDCDTYELYKNLAIESQDKKGKKNFKGATLSYIYAERETEIVKKAIDYYIKGTRKNPFYLSFDGFTAPRIDNDFLEEISNHAGYKFTLKEIKNTAISPDLSNDGYCKNSIKAIYYLNKLDKINLSDLTDQSIAESALIWFGGDFVGVGKTLYTYHKDRWRTGDGLANQVLCDALINIYRTIIIHLNTEIIKTQQDTDNKKSIETKLDCLNKLIQKIQSNSGANNVFSKFKRLIEQRCDNVTFDVNLPLVVVFENTAINVETGAFYKVKKSDYNTFSTGYNYVKPTRKQMETIDKIIKDTLPDEECRKSVLSVWKSCLKGVRQEKFIMFEGSGRNGKGMMNELLMKTLGTSCYAYSGHISSLTKEIKDGPTPEIAQFHLKRFIKFEEPNDCDTIKLGNVKKFTGEGFLNARQCHSNNCELQLTMTMVFECNAKPLLDGSIGAAEIDRFILELFPTHFTDDAEDLANEPHAKPCNPLLKEKEFQDAHRCAYFDYIVKNGLNKIYQPAVVKQRTRKYLMDNDDLFNFFMENYEKTDIPNSYVTLHQLHSSFHDEHINPDIKNMTKQKKTKFTKSKLKDKIIKHVELNKYYKDRHEGTYNVIIGWKAKEVIQEEDDCFSYD